MLDSIIFYTGIFALSSTALKFARLAWIYLRPSSLPRYHHGPDEPWALITGSTDGFGFGFAQELCSHGFNVILHGRSATKLAAKAAALQAAFPARHIRTFQADALSPDTTALARDLARLATLLDGLTLTVLINNVGGTEPVIPDVYRAFADTAPADIEGMLHFNAGFALQLTRAVMPALLRCEPALLINIGSHADAGSPYVATYAGSKAFGMAWAKALRAEMQAEGREVEVLGVVSGLAQSGSVREETSLLVPSARTVARDALGKVGCGRSMVSAYWVHGLQRGFLDALPESWSRNLLVTTLKKMMRNKAVEEAKEK